MRSNILAAIFLLISVSANAQTHTYSMEEMVEADTRAINGFQFGIRKSFSDQSGIEVENKGEVADIQGQEIHHQLGISAGYAEHVFQSLGFKGLVNYDQYKIQNNQNLTSVGVEQGRGLHLQF